MKKHALPGFVAEPETSLSGRLLSSLGTDGDPVPCVLVAHHLPGFRGLGSAVHVLAAVGPSDTSFPFYPLGGVTVVEGAMQILRAVDDNLYHFEYRGTPVDFDDLEHDIYDADTLIEATLRLVADGLELIPWDDEKASKDVASSEGWDYFDEFMAIPVQEFPDS